VYEDVPLFTGLIGDLFPGLACPRVRYPDFNDAVEEVTSLSLLFSVTGTTCTSCPTF